MAVPPLELASPPAAPLLKWYDRHRRTMPWRAALGELPDPYRVWLSEIMLQQTTVAAVIPYFNRFLARFPTVSALASADTGAVMEAWAGLGYYARARNLHACAKQVVAGGAFPSDLDELRALPGVGPYTAAAIGSIAFAIPVVPIDGNVERVSARIFNITTPLPVGKSLIASGAARLGKDPEAQARPSDFTQALFDLGAGICSPRAPLCALCPWMPGCHGRAAGNPERLPIKAAKKPRPIRYGAHFWLQDAAGRVLLRRRPENGLLGGMLELPGTAWRASVWNQADAVAQAPQPADWQLAGKARHGFTHFELLIDVYVAEVQSVGAEGMLLPLESLAEAALPTVMRHCIDVAYSRK